VREQRSKTNQSSRFKTCRGEECEERTEVVSPDDWWSPKMLGRLNDIFDVFF